MENKLTDNEIIKAFERCLNRDDECEIVCPYSNCNNICYEQLYRDVFGLINRLKAEIERLQLKISSCILENAELKAEIDRLLRSLNETNKYIPKIKERTRTEAIKEFAERLKEKAYSPNPYPYIEILTKEDIDSLVKEMVGADEDKL